ncbi:MAG: hypothetical protein FWF96_05760 [Kiritimatiellaeota bacterium]|nr:hypothetical protein [Kiritimatiellota bacterium]
MTALFLAAACSAQTLPPDAEYVIASKDGYLTVGGVRQRYWAAIGKQYSDSGVRPADTPEERAAKVARAYKNTGLLLDHFQAVGFNSFRLWTAVPDTEDYVKGDGSEADSVDYFLAQCAERGLKVWIASLNGGRASSSDAGIIADPATEAAWKKAADALGGGAGRAFDLRNLTARFWDPRLEQLAIEHMRRVALHTNKHTGLRWADDPVFGVWELSNEEWWMGKMVGGQWQRLPEFFRASLITQWNEFLLKKYETDAALEKAWEKLLPGESLARGSVALLPMAGATKGAVAINDASAHAAEALRALEQDYKREDFSRARGGDVLEFFTGLHISHKQREAAALKPLGKSLTLCPMVFDTGIGYEIQSQYLHQHADAVAHDAYVNGTGPSLESQMKKRDGVADPHRRNLATQDAERISVNTPDGLWVNWLLKPPGIHQGVPWLEHNKIEGKPYLAYETQIQQPAKYRADFPLRIAALASIQDWDWICWHYFGGGAENNLIDDPARHFHKAMDVTVGSHPQGYHFTYDAVQNAQMKAASAIFRNHLVKPAPNPAKFIYGRKSLYNPDSMDYAGSYGRAGLDMAYTTYEHGVRVWIDPAREDDEVIGPVVSFDDRHDHNPYRASDGQVTFDWKAGWMKFDAPGAAAFAGLFANYEGDSVKFSSNATLGDIVIENDAGIPYPVTDDEKFFAFSLVSNDGLPFAESASLTLALNSTSFNSGFEITPSGTKGGNLPVLYARVGGRVTLDALAGMTYEFLDWGKQPIGSGTVPANGALDIPVDKPIWVVRLTRGE